MQTAIDEQLADLGRIHNARDYVYATNLLKGQNFSTDVMLGLKNQTKEDVKKTIELAHACGSKHISMYALKVEDGTPIFTDYLNGELPDDDEVAEMYEYGRQLLEEKGYKRYEISNFAKPGCRSQHNSIYWNDEKYLGLGPSAHSYDGNSRQWNISNLTKYIQLVNADIDPDPDMGRYYEKEILSTEDKFNEYVMTSLRTSWGCDIEKISAKYGSSYSEHFLKNVKKKCPTIIR